MKTVEKNLLKIAFYIFDLYDRLKSYIFRGDYNKKHIIFQKDGGQIKVSFKSHDDFVEEKQEKIDGFGKKTNEAKYIQFALEQAIDGCNYIIFSKGEKYVQFWTSRGKLDFEFLASKVNGNKKHYYSVMGLLAEMDFVRDSFVPSQIPTFTSVSQNHVYKVESVGDLKKITAYFKKRVEQATEFTVMMFKQIYKTKKGNLKIEVG